MPPDADLDFGHVGDDRRLIRHIQSHSFDPMTNLLHGGLTFVQIPRARRHDVALSPLADRRPSLSPMVACDHHRVIGETPHPAVNGPGYGRGLTAVNDGRQTLVRTSGRADHRQDERECADHQSGSRDLG